MMFYSKWYVRVISSILTAALLHTLSLSFTTSIVHGASQDEVEPNDTPATAQVISAIGADNPINAAINVSNDRDWFRISANQGDKFTVEVFNVVGVLGNSKGGFNCTGNGAGGMAIVVQDQNLTTVGTQCNAGNGGTGNVNNRLVFEAQIPGNFFVNIFHNSPTSNVGSYSLRILPIYTSANAFWDPITFEPNNVPINAYAITPGFKNALSSTIEKRNASYSTDNPDEDWYRFEALEGETYAIELFNVDLTLNGGGFYCAGNGNGGVSLAIFNASEAVVASQCNAFGVGNVHNRVEFKVGISGIFFVRVLPNGATPFGNYSIRVLPKYDQPNADWDATSYEPNNGPSNAYLLSLPNGRIQLTSTIEARNSSYSTNAPDEDWYRFEVVEGQKYHVELYDVATSHSPGGFYCTNGGAGGLGLLVYDSSVKLVAGRCQGGNGNPYNIADFTASTSGAYYIRVIPSGLEGFGPYSLRVNNLMTQQKVYLPLLTR